MTHPKIKEEKIKKFNTLLDEIEQYGMWQFKSATDRKFDKKVAIHKCRINKIIYQLTKSL